jgi:hypothetical protein
MAHKTDETLEAKKEKLRDALAQAVIDDKLYGSQRVVCIGMVEPDGRKHGTLHKWAIAEGLATNDDGAHKVFATDKAFDSYPESDPKLEQAWALRGLPAIVFRDLPVEFQKWIIQRGTSEYALFTVDKEEYKGKPDIDTENEALLRTGTRWEGFNPESCHTARDTWYSECEHAVSHRCIVIVVSHKLITAIEAQAYDVLTRRMMHANLGLELANLDVITHDEAAYIHVHDKNTNNPFSEFRPFTLNPDASQWPTQIGMNLDKVLDKIEKLTADAKTLRKLQGTDWAELDKRLRALADAHINENGTWKKS